uniref:Putative ternary complex factor MIP1 n=1 Tax=Phyllostachys edulis TaxID=38705 RepID=D3IVN0_PHYED|nr:putative ternary complex factor MIP1 [Phyllostachys edulis]
MENSASEVLMETTFYCAETPKAGLSSSHLLHRHSRSSLEKTLSVISTHGNVLDISPRFSYHKPTTNQDKMLRRRYSLNLPEHLPDHHMIITAEQTEKAISKPVADLVWEIAALEEEVVRKELHLLSLYRAAFDQYLGVSPRVSGQHSQGLSRSSSGQSSLANFLSASIAEYVPKISCKLSEDIIRCISAVYCKLASRPSKDADVETSSTPSFSSSSSTFSLNHRVDSWSPRFHYNVNTSSDRYGSLNENNEQYSGMIIFPRIHIDADKFDYASKMLETIRALIKRLEKIDPTKMAHEEQLCFWINIHNALVMHAFMAYGLQDKRMKNTDMILKAAYNVGGHSVNSEIIQNSILGCQSHRPSLVRLYTAKKTYHQLNQARSEFIRANVMVRKQIIFLPKVLHYYAKDANLELPDLVEMVCESMSAAQQKEIRQCLRRRIDKCVEFLPYKSSFRYTVHRNLAE